MVCAILDQGNDAMMAEFFSLSLSRQFLLETSLGIDFKIVSVILKMKFFTKRQQFSMVYV